MRTVFADSFYFMAAINERDTAHARAVDFAEQPVDRRITTEWILTEVGDAFANPK
jgi:hypothetical protein